MSHILEVALEFKIELADAVGRIEHTAEVAWLDFRLLASLYVAKFIVWRHLSRVRHYGTSQRGGG